jgi:hypothetical protein
MAAKTIDSYGFLHGIERRMLKRWVSLPRKTQIPWISFRHSAFEMYRIPCKFSRDRIENRSARLLRIMLDRLVLVLSECERRFSSAADWCGAQV